MTGEVQAPPPRRSGARQWRPYTAARAYVRAQALPTAPAYRTWTQRPADLPSDPRAVYPAAWTGWDDWLGRAPRRWRPFAAARAFMHAQGLHTAQAFFVWRRPAARPRDIPAAPQRVYARAWQGWCDWVRCPVVGTEARDEG